MKNPLFSKLLTLGAVIALLAIFLQMIQGIISERLMYRNQALDGMSQTVAGPQTLLGPMLHMACVEAWDKRISSKSDGADRVQEERREMLHAVVPSSLNVQALTTSEQRSRSIYSTQVLQTKATLKAQFELADALKPKSSIAGARIQFGSPILMVALDDPRGIRHASARVNGVDYKLKAGTFHPSYKRGMHVQLPPSALQPGAEGWQAELLIEFVGTQHLQIVPLGETTLIRMESNWPHPSFSGRFAPAERKLHSKGFNADWRLTSVATDAPALATQAKPLCDAHSTAPKDCVEAIQVSFIDPVNAYSLSDRASKYGLLFVALTFVAVGMFEVMKKLRVHPVQYLLAGAAICTFFLLLVSLSEHIGFARAYATGAFATVLLLTYYASFMLGGKWRGLPFGAGMTLLYGFLYVLLQLEQTALVMGSALLFIVLALVMTLTRKINWYEQFASPPQAELQPTPATAAEAA
ncbi:MAG: cell envelope integrity protein CreD [Brachymonas sp.]